MAKWSQVDSAEVAGHKVARFMFAQLKNYSQVRISGHSQFSSIFYKSFYENAAALGVNTLFRLNPKSSPPVDSLKMKIMSVDNQNFEQLCQSRQFDACIGLKASAKLSKRKGNERGVWMSLYRLSDDEVRLYYRDRRDVEN